MCNVIKPCLGKRAILSAHGPRMLKEQKYKMFNDMVLDTTEQMSSDR